MKYKFQFNNDSDSCEALKSMIDDCWIVQGYIEEDGYTFFLMERYAVIKR